ncbi:MAG TPA: SEC-C metal-binding domain-containing protein [Candidatus Eisenbacteria bacterium]|nr:SEC-C metal-binding domain-containing protein [Candidatus Eisenbacteria bacterium]
MNRQPGRNEPCSCGSGRKYKNCCEGKTRIFGQKIPGAAIWVLVAVAGVGVAAYAMLRPDRPEPTMPAAVPPEERPAPYTYDSLTNRHFDPVHGHWHDGRPPGSPGAPGQGTGTPASGTAPAPAPPPTAAAPSANTPEPWTYDAEKNQHWDPTHQHWHPGLPPAGR